MIIDAIRRQAEYYWFLIIIFFAPIGGLIYFFVVKVHDFRVPSLKAGTVAAPLISGPSLPQLRQRVQESPSLANHLAYAEGLRETKNYKDASAEYDIVLRRDPDNKESLHGMGLCALESDDAGAAVKHLSHLMDIEPRYRDYAAALDYAEALWLDGQKGLCLEVLEDLTSTSTRIDHRVAYANYLALSGDAARAKETLEVALKDYELSPSFVKKRDRGYARDAERILAQLG